LRGRRELDRLWKRLSFVCWASRIDGCACFVWARRSATGEATESFPKPRKGSGFSFRAEGEKEFMAFYGFCISKLWFLFFETFPDLTRVCRLVGDRAAYLEFG
jgi:hypothetical protein